MALIFISNNTNPTYTALFTDIVANKIEGANIVGSTIFLTDVGAWKIIEPDLTLSDFSMGVTITSPLETNGGIPVNIQDQTTPAFDFYFAKAIAAPTTLAVTAAINDVSITVTSDTNFTAGDFIGLFSGIRSYFGIVLTKPGSNVLTLDTPIDYPYPSGSVVLPLNRNMGVDGSSVAQIFELKGPLGADLEIDVTRIMLTMITNSAVDLSLFGDITALTKGLVLRRVDGETRNLWNVKDNHDFVNLAYDVEIFAAANSSQGIDGLAVRYSLAGQDKHGVTVRLAAGEALELIVQDDLSALSLTGAKFNAIGQGHLVTD